MHEQVIYDTISMVINDAKIHGQADPWLPDCYKWKTTDL